LLGLRRRGGSPSGQILFSPLLRQTGRLHRHEAPRFGGPEVARALGDKAAAEHTVGREVLRSHITSLASNHRMPRTTVHKPTAQHPRHPMLQSSCRDAGKIAEPPARKVAESRRPEASGQGTDRLLGSCPLSGMTGWPPTSEAPYRRRFRMAIPEAPLARSIRDMTQPGRENIADLSRQCRALVARQAQLPSGTDPGKDPVVRDLLAEVTQLPVPHHSLQFMGAMAVGRPMRRCLNPRPNWAMYGLPPPP